MNLKKWLLVSSKIIFQSKFLTLKDNSYQFPDGTIKENYYHLDRPDYVLIIAINDKNELLVERQYRRGVDDFVYELPAGWVEEKETIIETSKRELQEETGFSISSAELVGQIYPQPGFCSMKAFIVKVVMSSKSNSVPESDEKIESQFIPLETVKQMVRDNQIKDMGFLSALSLSGLLK